MRYSAIQPQYFPRLHYFARMLHADVFVIRDDCQFVRTHKYPDGTRDKSYQAHTPIKHPDGKYFLSIPILHEGYKTLVETGIAYKHSWVLKHINTIRPYYSRAPLFPRVYGEIEILLKKKYKTLAELNITTILWGIARLLGSDAASHRVLTIAHVEKMLAHQRKFRLKKLVRATQTKTMTQKKNLSASEKIISLIREVGADEDYCGGTGYAAYMEQDLFKKSGIKVTVQDWNCEPYPQRFDRRYGFVPNLSIIDLLMNVESHEAARIIAG